MTLPERFRARVSVCVALGGRLVRYVLPHSLSVHFSVIDGCLGGFYLWLL